MMQHASCAAQGLVRQAEIVDADASDSDEEGMGNAHSPEAGQEPASPPGGLVLYTRGVRSCHFTLVLQVRLWAQRSRLSMLQWPLNDLRLPACMGAVRAGCCACMLGRKRCGFCPLLLLDSWHSTGVVRAQGRLIVNAGSEGFLSEMGPWSFLGAKALSAAEPYVPDFDAKAPGGCRLLRIHADAYSAALRMGKAENIVGARAIRQARAVYCAPASCLFCALPAAFSGHLSSVPAHGLWRSAATRSLGAGLRMGLVRLVCGRAEPSPPRVQQISRRESGGLPCTQVLDGVPKRALSGHEDGAAALARPPLALPRSASPVYSNPTFAEPSSRAEGEARGLMRAQSSSKPTDPERGPEGSAGQSPASSSPGKPL
jgi:hypothetical protein